MQLKVIQEVITLLVVVAFAWRYLDERLRWNEGTAFALVLGAVGSSPACRDAVKQARSNVAEDGKTYLVIAVRISR